jgi:hypothetical protein
MALLAARKEGARVFVRDGRLVIQSPGQLPADILAGLKEHRDRLVEILLMPTAQQPVLLPEALVLEPIKLVAVTAEYDRLGAEIDALADQVSAARLAGKAEEAERLGEACRALVEGPYRTARLRCMSPASGDEVA